jgi:hypothetical protein
MEAFNITKRETRLIFIKFCAYFKGNILHLRQKHQLGLKFYCVFFAIDAQN